MLLFAQSNFVLNPKEQDSQLAISFLGKDVPGAEW